MSNSSNEIVEHTHGKSFNWAGVAVILTMFAIILLGSACGFGYFQLTQLNMSLTRQVSDLGSQIDSSQSRFASMQSSIDKLQSLSEKAESLTTQQEQMIKNWEASQKQQADITSLYVKLSVLNQQIDNLPLAFNTSKQGNVEPEVLPADASWWRQGLNNTWKALSKVVVVRYTGANALPLVLPEEKVFLYQNLHAQMENILWAVLNRNNEVFHASLERSIHWIQQYFQTDSAMTKQLLSSLEELQQTNLQPAIINVEAAAH